MPEQLPQWNAVGVEPPASLKSTGWEPGMKPSAQHMNWLFNRAFKCLEELQTSGANVTQLQQDLNALEQVVTENSNNLTTTNNNLTSLNNAVTTHLDDDVKHITASERTTWNNKQDYATDNAKFKKSSSTYTDNDTSQTFTDTFCTVNSLVTVVITSVTAPQGVWSVVSANGSFTITSTVAETNDITFDYYIQKAVG